MRRSSPSVSSCQPCRSPSTGRTAGARARSSTIGSRTATGSGRARSIQSRLLLPASSSRNWKLSPQNPVKSSACGHPERPGHPAPGRQFIRVDLKLFAKPSPFHKQAVAFPARGFAKCAVQRREALSRQVVPRRNSAAPEVQHRRGQAQPERRNGAASSQYFVRISNGSSASHSRPTQDGSGHRRTSPPANCAIRRRIAPVSCGARMVPAARRRSLASEPGPGLFHRLARSFNRRRSGTRWRSSSRAGR